MTRPLQVYLAERDLARLTAWASRRGWTKSQAVRVAVRALTKEQGGDPLLDASGMIEGLPADLSVNFDRHLEETFVIKTSQVGKPGRSLSRPRLRR